MKLAFSTMADVVIAWFERFELNELKNEKQTSLVDDVLLEICQRADRARRQGEWDTAQRQCQLALDRATGWRKITGDDETPAEQTAMYSGAMVHFYAGAVALARIGTVGGDMTWDLCDALDHFQRSAKMFGDLRKRRAESIAQAATGIVHAVYRKWADAVEAYQQSIALIDRLSPLNSSLKDLRRQIVQTVPMILEYYEQEAR